MSTETKAVAKKVKTRSADPVVSFRAARDISRYAISNDAVHLLEGGSRMLAHGTCGKSTRNRLQIPHKIQTFDGRTTESDKRWPRQRLVARFHALQHALGRAAGDATRNGGAATARILVWSGASRTDLTPGMFFTPKQSCAATSTSHSMTVRSSIKVIGFSFAIKNMQLYSY